jgi:hypothetical protein
MKLLLRRILLAVIAACAATTLAAAPALAVTAAPASLPVASPAQPGDDDDDGRDDDRGDDARGDDDRGDDDDRGRVPVGGVQTGTGGFVTQPGDDDDDDDGGAPSGGVDAGAGGAAADTDLALPLGGLAGVAALTGGAVLVRRLASRAG